MKSNNNSIAKKDDNNFLATVPLTKEGITQIASGIVKSVLDGDKNALEANVQLKCLEDLAVMTRKNVYFKREVMNEADKYPEKSFEDFGAKITKTSRSTFTYTACNDSVWDDLNRRINELSDQKKRRETFLKGIEVGATVVSEETGEVILPPLKESSDVLRVSLK